MKKYLIIAVLFTVLIYGCTQPPVQPQDNQITDDAIQQNADEGKQTIQPAVYVDGQQIKGDKVLIRGVTSAEPSWIVIHADLNGNPGPVIGYVSVKEGETNDVAVKIDSEKATDTLFAMLHSDKGNIGAYEFPGEDAPVTVDGKVINVGFKATKMAKQSEPEDNAIAAAPALKEFAISADDIKFYPSTVTVKKGDKVKITFSFNDEKIYYGGLDIKSEYFTVTYRKSDLKTKTAEFTADKSFTFTSYWPSSGVKKAAGKVEVT